MFLHKLGVRLRGQTLSLDLFTLRITSRVMRISTCDECTPGNVVIPPCINATTYHLIGNTTLSYNLLNTHGDSRIILGDYGFRKTYHSQMKDVVKFLNLELRGASMTFIINCPHLVSIEVGQGSELNGVGGNMSSLHRMTLIAPLLFYPVCQYLRLLEVPQPVQEVLDRMYQDYKKRDPSLDISEEHRNGLSLLMCTKIGRLPTMETVARQLAI